MVSELLSVVCIVVAVVVSVVVILVVVGVVAVVVVRDTINKFSFVYTLIYKLGFVLFFCGCLLLLPVSLILLLFVCLFSYPPRVLCHSTVPLPVRGSSMLPKLLRSYPV